jgi:murein DD-endopeptidase MepM/ murein hydrolase activator NlpD
VIFSVGTVSAQEEEPQGPQYIVQPGDTLSKIAVRFDISLNDLINANGISNPDEVFVGTPLVLPGVDWIDGVLDTRIMPLGESFMSLVRRYSLDEQTFAHLSGVVNPAQLRVGYPVLLATNRGEELNSARKLVNTQSSLLELSLISGFNPWSLVAANQLDGTWDIIPGDVILLPGTNDPGPGAVPSPLSNIDVEGGEFVQGKTTILRVGAGGLPLQITGFMVDRRLTFFEHGDGDYVALQGVHVMSTPGFYPISIVGALPSGEIFELTQLVEVKEGEYESEKITVDPSYLDPAVTQPEEEYIAAIASAITGEKYWSGVFLPPSPYADVINSKFGTRRSFNGSPYNYYHSGVDFGGGSGVEIYAPASGVVVFSGPLEVRGNATIIDHGWGIFSGYWHQNEAIVQVGDVVEPGQVIGFVGNTGRSSGAHLHWEIWVGGVQVEPMDWLYQTFP